MHYTCLEVRNFKGIKHLKIDFASKPISSIYTLIGLNESGKTTILEAIDYLSALHLPESIEGVRALDPNFTSVDPRDLIPMGRRGMFTDVISVKAEYLLDDDDKQAIMKFLSDEIGFVQTKPVNSFVTERVHKFAQSALVQEPYSYIWSLNPVGHYDRPGDMMAVDAVLAGSGDSRPDWLKLIEFVKTRLPSPIYFPDFLFDFPNSIPLEDVGNFTKEQTHRNRTYRAVLQDVLNTIGDGADLTQHVLNRAKSSDYHDRQALEALLLVVDRHMTQTIFGNWNKIFNRPSGNRQVVTNCDRGLDGQCLFRIRIKENNQFYEVSERSLGFRWFFSFMLLTQYRGHRKGPRKNALFLFDEPASNLHPSAQKQLLDSFAKIENCSIMYATHSHHMVNPSWLESTYIVKNKGLDYALEDSYVVQETDISIEKYRTFAANHPNQTTYFQPVLDVLDYRVGDLENVPDVLLVEGKNDFYTLNYFQDKILNRSLINLMPGNGSGSLDAVIRLYLGWGRKFVVLLDSDKSGSKEKQRYIDVFGPVVRDCIFCLSDVESDWANTEMEGLVEKTDQLMVMTMNGFPATSFDKKQFNRSIQEAYLTNRVFAFNSATVLNLEKILNFCASKLH